MIKQLLKKGIIKGYIEAIDMENGVFLSRFTEKQREYSGNNNNRHVRMCCQAGITMDMQTDARYIEFDYTVYGFTRAYANFDVVVNNYLNSSVSFETIEKGENYHFKYEVPGPVGMLKRVTVYFPHNVWMHIRNLVLSPKAKIKPVKSEAKNILIMGDSITQGMDSTHPTSTYATVLTRMLQMNALNQAIGGDIFDSRLLDPELPFNPDLITVAYGTNDWTGAVSIDEFKQRCTDFIKKLTTNFENASINLITPIYRFNADEVKPTGTLYEHIQIIKDICREFPKINVIDGLELVKPDSEIYKDKVHPNDMGHMQFAQNLFNAVK